MPRLTLWRYWASSEPMMLLASSRRAVRLGSTTVSSVVTWFVLAGSFMRFLGLSLSGVLALGRCSLSDMITPGLWGAVAAFCCYSCYGRGIP